MNTKSKVLCMLYHAENDLSGEQIGKALGVSRAAVSSAVLSLRNDGFVIEAATKRGYRLIEIPDRLLDEALMVYLDNEERSELVHCLDSTGSTNSTLIQMSIEGAPDGSVVISERQTSGYGRMNREFYSPADMGIYFSYLIKPGVDKDAKLYQPSRWTSLTCRTAVAVTNAIETLCGERPSIKWVNDLYMGNRKICGILTQMDIEPESGRVRSIVVGIGINVHEEEKDFHPDLQKTAGSIYMQTGKRIRRPKLAAEIIREMDIMLKDFPADSESYLERYRKDSCITGKTVDVVTGENKRTAVVCGIDNDFALHVRYQDGSEEHMHGGEISIRL